MKKALVILTVLICLATSSMAAGRGGFMGGLHGCCFGLRGAAAYNDGKQMTAIEWIDALLTSHIIAFIQGWSGITTADLQQTYGSSFF
ncbi:MAG: hypothetical protein J6Y19_04795 [Kiritimatiellae bacterium]|nr:hypothetical protein [Kiritimatiellia bacterium]